MGDCLEVGALYPRASAPRQQARLSSPHAGDQREGEGGRRLRRQTILSHRAQCEDQVDSAETGDRRRTDEKREWEV